MRILVEALPKGHIVPQMAMSALVDIAEHQKRGLRGRQLGIRRSAFSQKRLDFVVLDAGDYSVVAVIELDDHTHDSKARKAEDAARDAILESVGYPVVRFDARRMPSVALVRSRLPA